MTVGLKANADGSGAVQVGGSDAISISSAGTITAVQPAGLGYGTGSGGTVTQATSKSTAVTLNKPTGQITMNNAALAANASVSFALTNSTKSGADLIVANIAGGIADGSAYTLQVTGSSGSTIGFILKNVSAASLSEAIVINFAIIKGATS